MRRYKFYLILGFALLAISLVLAACGSTPAEPTKPPPAQEPTAVVLGPEAAPTTVAPTTAPEPAADPAPTGATNQITLADIPNVEAWQNSPHADAASEAFNHWNKADPVAVPTSCAMCHSTPGYQDFLGADGSAAGTVDQAAPVGTVITCKACHNEATANLTSVTFPSGAEVTGLDSSARCMVCHQGRESKVSVDNAITKAAAADDDTVSDQLKFINIHYAAAGATQYGSVVHGAYEYDGQTYDGKFQHVAGYDTCISCHDSHSTEVKVQDCQTCHTNVKTAEDLKNIRMQGSMVDYNGNGNVEEGISAEVAGMQDMLLQAIQAYGKEVVKAPIAYSASSYPYFFADANDNGKVDDGEKAYASWTPRLLKAAYNYQTSIKDAGAYAHNAKYTIEYLYDSIADLNTKLSTPVDLSKAHRTDAGHFDGTSPAFRHWDSGGAVETACAKCHSATGLPEFLATAAESADKATGTVEGPQPLSNGLACTTCHSDLTTFARYQVSAVKFPSGAVLSFGENADANLCISCHQARESTVSVNAAITKAAAATDDTVSDKLKFINSHYLGAGATLFGTEAQGAYQYDGKEYSGQFKHVDSMSTCVNCHETHTGEVKTQVCVACHSPAKTVDEIRAPGDTTDYNGNGNATEGIAQEIKGMSDTLYAAIQDYAKTKAGTAIVYDTNAYPYFFADTNGNGKVDEGEKSYASWTPRLLRAAYNLQWVNKDPGAFAHNGPYMMQVLYDSIQDLGGNVSGMTRPEVTPVAGQ